MNTAHQSSRQLPTPNATPQRPRAIQSGHRNIHALGRGLPLHVIPRRHRKLFADNLQASFNKPSIRRLARRGGVIRVGLDVYEGARYAAKARVTEILRRAVELVYLTDRKTVTALDIVYALNNMGTPVYGFGIVEKAAPESKAKEKRQLRARQRKEALEREQAMRREMQRRIDRDEHRNAAMERMDNWVRETGGNVHSSQEVLHPFDEMEDVAIPSVE